MGERRAFFTPLAVGRHDLSNLPGLCFEDEHKALSHRDSRGRPSLGLVHIVSVLLRTIFELFRSQQKDWRSDVVRNVVEFQVEKLSSTRMDMTKVTVR